MKYVIFTFLILAFSYCLQAANSDYFSYDKAKIETEFSELSAMEGFVKSNNGVTLSQIKTGEVNSNIDFNDLIAASATSSVIDDMDWGSYAWGCLCCPIGFFVVILDDDKTKSEKDSFWLGVLTSVAVNAVLTALQYSAVMAMY